MRTSSLYATWAVRISSLCFQKTYCFKDTKQPQTHTHGAGRASVLLKAKAAQDPAHGREKMECCQTGITRDGFGTAMCDLTQWQKAAKQKWPRAQVQGDGPFAMYSACCASGLVLLYNFAQEAVDAMNHKCPHANCSENHGAYKLRPPVENTVRVPITVGWGD